MSKSKRAVSLLIAFLMLLGLMPFGMLADGPTGELPDIVIMKVDEEGEGLSGGSYSLYEATVDSANGALTTGDFITTESAVDGFINFGQHPEGWYVIEEDQAPPGYLTTNDMAVVHITHFYDEATDSYFYASVYFGDNIILDEDGSFCSDSPGSGLLNYDIAELDIGYVAFVNKAVPGIVIKKVDEDGNPLKGGVFSLYIAEYQVEGDTPYTPGVKIKTASADENGFVNFGKQVTYYEYVIVEEEAPKGYIKSDEIIAAYIDTDFIDEITGEYIIRYFSKDIIKTDDGGYCYYEIFTPIDGYVRGYAAFVNEKAAEEETDAPSAEIVIMKVDGRKQDWSTVPHIIGNNPIKGGLFALSKYSYDNHTFDSDEDFEAYLETVPTATADENGFVRFQNVGVGEYYIIELTPPDNYIKSTGHVRVQVKLEDDGETFVAYYCSSAVLDEGGVEVSSLREGWGTPKRGYAALVNMKLHDIDVVIMKVDEDGNPLKGGLFALNEIVSEELVEIDTAAADDDGFIRFKFPGYTHYLITELEAPFGYANQDDSVYLATDWDPGTDDDTVEIYYKAFHYVPDENGERVSVETIEDEVIGYAALVNKKLPSTDIVIKKVDEKGNNLSKGKFELWYVTDYDDETDEYESEKVAEAVAADGVVKFKGVPEGLYLIKETAAPDGYLATNDEIWVDIEIEELGLEEDGSLENPEYYDIVVKINYYSDNVIADDDGFTVFEMDGEESTTGFAAFVNEKKPVVDTGELPEAGGTSASMILLAAGTPLISAGAVLTLSRRKKRAKI